MTTANKPNWNMPTAAVSAMARLTRKHKGIIAVELLRGGQINTVEWVELSDQFYLNFTRIMYQEFTAGVR